MITIIPQLPALFISDELCYTENIAKIDTMEGKNLCPSSACFYHHRRHHCQRAHRTGLKPVLTSEELLAHLPELQQLCCPETLNLCSIDSTDLGPEHWLMMAKAVQENYALYDGFIICHGTDTLAYSAAALSYLIQNADKPSSSRVPSSPFPTRSPMPRRTCGTA